MNAEARDVQRTYLLLLLLHTLAASFIWGINTLFLLDAGLSNAQAFAANAFFTAGLVLCEVPTGIVADTRGRRFSYLLGTVTLSLSTFAYLLMWRIHAPMWAWAISSALLGLGFTFFSGAVEAWLVDALRATGYDGALDRVFARGKIVEGGAMLVGAIGGGVIAQVTNLGVPYMIRACVLVASFALAFFLMRDLGFKPRRAGGVLAESKSVLKESFRHGLAHAPVRWLMLGSIFSSGVTMYGFYAMQPYLLQLWGDPKAYWIAGLSAAVFAGAQIAGGLAVRHVAHLFNRRTSALILAGVLSVAVLTAIGLVPKFWAAITLMLFWSLLFAAVMPIRQTYLNSIIPSEQRATVISFDSLMGSAGGVGFQPLLGKAADLWGYPMSYLCSAAIQLFAIPFAFLARRDAVDHADVLRE